MTDTYALDPSEDQSAEVVPLAVGAGSGVGRDVERLARARDDISGELTEQQLASMGADVVREWMMDLASNKDWRKKAEDALDAAAQEEPEPKDYPFKKASNVRYPLLTISSLAFASRAAPAIIKGDEAIKVKTFGKDPNGDKTARAFRMAEYLNWKLFYGTDGWEKDTDAMLHRLPAVGQHYRKVWWDAITRKPCVESVSALRLTIPADARSLKASPRITHDFDRYPYELQQLMARGEYRKVVLTPEGEDDQALRVILEQHRMMDLDEDGLDEPYIVTVDKTTEQVLRIEEAFDEDGIQTDAETNEIVSIERWCPFVDYGFIPDPKGRAYSIGFGHLLTPIMSAINTAINMQLDAGHAQVAGGGFVASEVRLQGAGQGGVLRFQPGEYKTVSASGQDLRNAIYERTFPNPSPVLFQLLGMLMEAAKDIASVSEAITGDSARTAPVGTTLALIEQGQQVFNGIYKRIYRGLREEFKLFADCIAKYGDPAEYARFCDVDPAPQQGLIGHNGGPPMAEPEPQAGGVGQAPAPQGLIPAGFAGADTATQPQPGMMAPATMPQPVDPAQLFKDDFATDDLDIRPVSDPSAVTKAQVLAKDQVALQFVGKGIYADDRLVIRQMLQDAGIEQAETWIPDAPAPPPKPSPLQLHAMAQEAEKNAATAEKDRSTAALNMTKAAEIAHKNTGEQADAQSALDHAEGQLKLAKAAAIAAGLLPNLEAGGQGGPVAVKPPAPEV